MLKPDQNDFSDDAGLQELLDQYHAFLEHREPPYFDEEALERLYEFFESRMNETQMETVADLAIRQNPYSGDFLVRKAELLYNRKDYKQALEYLDKALVFDSGNLDVYLLRSDIYVEFNRFEEAIALLEHALKMADKEEKDMVLAELSDVYEIQEDFQKAFQCLEEALQFNPESEIILMKFSHITDMTERYEDSIRLHLNIVDEFPYCWLAWYNLGRAYTSMGLYEKALEAFEFTIAIHEDFDLSHRDAADIYYRLEQYQKAIAAFEMAQEKSAGFDDFSFRIGLCYERLNDIKKARFHYRKATRQDPYFDEAFFRIADTYRMEERWEPALVNYKKALRIDDENELYITCIISIYRLLGRDEEVLPYLIRLTEMRNDILNYWLDLICYRYEQGQFSEGLEHIQSAIEHCGQFPEFEYLKALFLWYSGKQKESLKVLEQVLMEDPARQLILIETAPEFVQIPRIADLLETYR